MENITAKFHCNQMSMKSVIVCYETTVHMQLFSKSFVA